MRLRLAGSLLVAVVIASAALRATPADCPRDTKLIGQVSVFGNELEASWWHLIYTGMVVGGGFTTPNQQRDYLNGVFGTHFATLEEVRLFNLEGISAFDKNGNGFVCAYDLRGTRAYNDDPLFEFTWFGISDDKLR